MNYTTLKYEREGEIVRVTLARPEKRNAISTPMIKELLAAFDEAEGSGARVLILTGEGKAFCAGMDLEDLQKIAGQSEGENREDSRRMARLFRRLYTFPRPVIAAVNGAAVAGGCGLATLADFTLASPEAKFGYTEVKIGFLPALVSVFLRRQIGEKHARELLLTGKIVDAAEAYRLGLVNEIVPGEKLAARARELAASLLAVSPESVWRTKELLSESEEEALDEELERAAESNAEIRGTADFREGLASFLEKRQPKWSGR
ncbi:MAG TPA: enoyl-CoA hydratase-related protein [Verrucomicrobiae bacterium]|nr:enoyl-CoA hydratase-related protein [Verrucomicrobiae bacterium]